MTNVYTYLSIEEPPSRSVGAAALSMAGENRAGLLTMSPPAELTRRELARALVLSTRSPATRNERVMIRFDSICKTQWRYQSISCRVKG